MIIVRERVVDLVFHDLSSLYVQSADDRFAELFFEDLSGAQRILDRLVVPYAKEWPIEAKRVLGFALGASLVHRRAELIGTLMVSAWDGFDDPGDAMFGYVYRSLFPNRSLSEFVFREINWDSGPIDDFIEEHGPLPSHDWSEFQFPNPLRD